MYKADFGYLGLKFFGQQRDVVFKMKFSYLTELGRHFHIANLQFRLSLLLKHLYYKNLTKTYRVY